MIRKVHHIAVMIDCEPQQAIHWFELFQQVKQYLKANIYFVMWNSELADIARSHVDVDTVHLLSRSLFKLNDYQSMRALIQEYKIDICIEIGDIPQFIVWNLKKNPTIQKVKVYSSLYDKDSGGYTMNIYPDHTARVNYQQKRAYIPVPQINYKHFLDLDTQKVLDIKQAAELISYQDHVIHKSFVCGYLGDIMPELGNYLEYSDAEWYDILSQKGSFTIPPSVRNDLPTIYELLDCMVVGGEVDDTIMYHMLHAMASGTIVIAPRNEIYQSILGKGALYYTENSSSELNACIDILQRSDVKKREIRNYSSAQFQRKYSYQSIAQFWAQLLVKL